MKLEDLGITKDELIERLVENLSNNLYVEIENDVRSRIESTFKERIEINVDLMTANLCKETFEVAFIPVNNWGEHTGEQTTLKEMLKKSCFEFWDTFVDHEGKKTSYKKEARRYQYVAKQVLESILSNDVKQQAQEVFNEVKVTVKGAVTKALSKELIDKL